MTKSVVKKQQTSWTKHVEANWKLINGKWWKLSASLSDIRSANKFAEIDHKDGWYVKISRVQRYPKSNPLNHGIRYLVYHRHPSWKGEKY